MTHPTTPTETATTGPTRTNTESGDARSRTGSRDTKILFWVCQVAVIVPVWIAAYRDGNDGWYPTMDAATTVLRARDTFGGDFPLVGMWSSVSDKLGQATYFPGATELYWLSGPVHLFGVVWGALIGMAALVTVWLLIAGWLLRRRLGHVGAVWGLVFFGLLLWTMGSESILDVSPMQMVTIPFAVFLIAVWSVADRDLGAIPVLALLANYLFLNHLVLTLLVPTIGLVAPVALVIGLRRFRRDRPDGWPAERRRLIRQLIVAAAVTVVLWIPTSIQQFSESPGNLTNLYNASRVDLSRNLTMSHALDVVVTILTVPPFWFRDTFHTALESSPIGWGGIVLAVVVVGLITAAVVDAVRRGDRSTLTALAVAAVALVAAVANVLSAPTDFGYQRAYFRSLWGTAMFTWFAVGLAAVRALAARRPGLAERARSGRRPILATVGAAAVLVVAVANVPRTDPGPDTNGTSDASIELATRVMNRASAKLHGQGQVEVSSIGDFSSFGLSSTLILLLDSEGADVCVPADMVAQYSDARACDPGGPDVQVRVSSMAFPPFPDEQIIAEATLLTESEQDELTELTQQVVRWLHRRLEVRASPWTRQILEDAYGPAAADDVEALAFDDRGFGTATLAFDPDFVEFIATRSRWNADGTAESAVDTGGLDPEVLVRWADLTWREYTGDSVRISRLDPSAGFGAATDAAAVPGPAAN